MRCLHFCQVVNSSLRTSPNRLGRFVVRLGRNGIVIPHAVENRTIARRTLIVKIGVHRLTRLAVVTRMKTERNDILVVIDIFDNPLPMLSFVVDIRKMDKLQRLIRVLKKRRPPCLCLYHKGLYIPILLNDRRNLLFLRCWKHTLPPSSLFTCSLYHISTWLSRILL